jgi:hypothetical protein
VSVDLAVWEGSRPVSDADAVSTFERLYQEFLDEGEAAPPTEAIREYVLTLLRRYPDLPGESEEPSPEVPWGSGPLLRNASGPIVHLDLKLNSVFEDAWRYCVELAASRDLVAFDPQSGALAEPDPTATRGPAMTEIALRGTGIGARMYRWSSLRSYRWPVLAPVAALLRRFR